MVVSMFTEGQKRFSNKFTDSIRQDMGAIGYELNDIGVAPPISIIFEGILGEVVALYTKEADLNGTTDQQDISLIA